MTKQVININASSLRHASCLLNWYRVVVEGYVEPVFNAKIVYGIAVHKFIQEMYEGNSLMAAKESALKVFRQPKIDDDDAIHISNEQHFLWTCLDVWHNYALVDGEFTPFLKPNGKPAVEITFSIPFYEDDNIFVKVCGTIDTIGKIKNGCNAIRDWKSTSTPKHRRKSYLEDFEMKSQLRFYCMSLKLMARHFPDSQLGQLGLTRLGAFIDGIFLGEKPVELEVKRSAVFQFGDDDLGEFEAALTKRIMQLSSAIADGTVHAREGIVLNTCEHRYGRCGFFPVCRSNEPQIRKILLDCNFVQRPYDPLNRDK